MISLFVPLYLTFSFFAIGYSLPAFQRFSLGDFNGTVLTDGVYKLCSNPFQISDETFAKKMRSERRAISPAKVALNVVVVDILGKRVMVDTGSYLPPHLRDISTETTGILLDSMKMAGITPSSIDAVLLTHGHQDHVLGLVGPDDKATFKNAMVYISKVDHEFWTTPAQYNNSDLDPTSSQFIAQLYWNSISKYSHRLRLMEPNQSPFPGVRFCPTPGHTPGHSVIEFMGGHRSLFVTGDAWVFQGAQVKAPRTKFLFDSDRRQGVRSRLKLLRQLAKEQNLVLSYHEPFPGLGYIDKTRKSFRWITAAYEEFQPDGSLQCQ